MPDAKEEAMTTWTTQALFGDAGHPGLCCDCCDGYCPESDNGSHQDHVFSVGAYVSDRYVAIRADLIDVKDGDEWRTITYDPTAGWTVPDDMPPESSRVFTPSIAGRLLALGIHIGHSDDRSQPLYHDGQHIGWVAAADDGATLAVVRSYVGMLDTLRLRDDNNRYDPLRRAVDASRFNQLDALHWVTAGAAIAQEIDHA